MPQRKITFTMDEVNFNRLQMQAKYNDRSISSMLTVIFKANYSELLTKKSFQEWLDKQQTFFD